uniref:Regulatory protein zeste n=1 Tax=Plectus sambesii TaxID=2011161 RepID=A0A914V9P7_9BILA
MAATKERKMSFLAQHSARLVELVLERKEDLIDMNKSRAANAARRRKDKWEEVVRILNSEFLDFRCDVHSAQTHWTYRQSAAKSKHATARRVQRGTGGGPPSLVKPLNEAEGRIIDALGDTASFSGVPGGGVESPIGDVMVSTSSAPPEGEVTIRTRVLRPEDDDGP